MHHKIEYSYQKFNDINLESIPLKWFGRIADGFHIKWLSQFIILTYIDPLVQEKDILVSGLSDPQYFAFRFIAQVDGYKVLM